MNNKKLKEQLRQIVIQEIRTYMEGSKGGVNIVSDYASFMKADMLKNPGEWGKIGDDLDKINTKELAQKMIDKALKNGAKSITLSNSLKKALKKNGFEPTYNGLEQALDFMKTTSPESMKQMYKNYIAKTMNNVRGEEITEATPSKKAPEIDDAIKKYTGIDRVSTIKQNKCAICGKDAKKFKDKDSEKEYAISGMCQDCQDKFFD